MTPLNMMITLLLLKFYTAKCDAADINNSLYGRSTSSPLSASQRTLTAIKVSPDGDIYPTKILKQQLANELNLPLRDLRVVDPSFPTSIQTTFTARRKAILFCIDNIKVVVQHHEALVFNPSSPEVEAFIPILQQNILQNLDISSVITTSNSGSGSSDSNNNQPKIMRFEHVVLETALNVVCNSLYHRVQVLSPLVTSTLNGLRLV